MRVYEGWYKAGKRKQPDSVKVEAVNMAGARAAMKALRPEVRIGRIFDKGPAVTRTERLV